KKILSIVSYYSVHFENPISPFSLFLSYIPPLIVHAHSSFVSPFPLFARNTPVYTTLLLQPHSTHRLHLLPVLPGTVEAHTTLHLRRLSVVRSCCYPKICVVSDLEARLRLYRI
ncbi:hypothetical protein VIGAN_04257500, partial [Vigna angularis var. angularis]